MASATVSSTSTSSLNAAIVDAIAKNSVAECERDWWLAQRPLSWNESQLTRDIGATEAKLCVASLSSLPSAIQSLAKPMFAWHGVSSRWRIVIAWLYTLTPTPSPSSSSSAAASSSSVPTTETKTVAPLPATSSDMLLALARHLGRVVSYRSLSLTDEQFATLKAHDSILPTGRLRSDKDTCRGIIDKHGAWMVAHARLYIGQRLIGPIDPSLSLHDDPETSICIAEGYMSLPERKIHCMAYSVPLLEVLGFTVEAVQGDGNQHRWFMHRGIWFDARDPRCERYCLYELPFFTARCTKLRVFTSKDEVRACLTPFKQLMLQRYRDSPEGQRGQGELDGDVDHGSNDDDE